ncbi:hypothetical protein [Sphaerisporangium sp. NPDC051011]|uniref:hypothetical protein n=1 Tax=Sphaerisporangium sp. NPDC051011 TaxID=3155792 RepID=UPI0033D4F750
MDLAKELRELQAEYDQATREHADKRATFESTSKAYDARRRYAPSGAETASARAAWALAGQEWLAALIARETLRDRVRSERRTVDEDANNRLLTPTRPSRPGP